MDKFPSIMYLPGHFCVAFRERTVLCSWKGGPSCTVLYFFLDDPDDSEMPPGRVRRLVSLEFDYVVHGHAEAKELAENAWDQHQEQILASDGGRLYVVGDELVE